MDPNQTTAPVAPQVMPQIVPMEPVPASSHTALFVTLGVIAGLVLGGAGGLYAGVALWPAPEAIPTAIVTPDEITATVPVNETSTDTNPLQDVKTNPFE